MPIGKDDIRKVAKLARLELTPNELDRLSLDLAQIIGYIDQIKSIDTAEIAPGAKRLKAENVLREDKILPSLPGDKALANAPDRDEEFFRVPKVIG